MRLIVSSLKVRPTLDIIAEIYSTRQVSLCKYGLVTTYALLETLMMVHTSVDVHAHINACFKTYLDICVILTSKIP